MRKFALVAVALMLASTLVPTGLGEDGSPGQRAVPRTVLFELFTCVNNTNCADDENASAKLAGVYSREQVAILQWYKTDEGLGSTDSSTRFTYYGIPESPRAFVDGRDASSNSNNDTVTYNTYNNATRAAFNDTPSASLDGMFKLGVNNATVNAKVMFLGTVPNSALALYFFLYEDNVLYKGNNNVTSHRYVARKTIAKVMLTSPIYRNGDHFNTTNITFTLSKEWNRANLGVVVALQSDGTRAVLQSKVLAQGAGVNYGVDLSPALVTQNVSAGKSAETTLRVTNTGSSPDSIDISTAGEAAAWATLGVSNVSLAPGSSTGFKVTIYVPIGSEARDYALTVRGTSRSDPDKFDDTSITVSVPAELTYGVSLSPSKQEQEVTTGRSVSFPIKVKNTGTLEDTIDLTLSAGQTSWGTLSKGSVSLPPNGEESVTLTVEVPEDAVQGRYDITITGTSRADGTKTSSAVATVKVSTGSSGSYGVDMQPRLVSKGIAPGGTTSLALTITNTGTARDTMDLSKTGDASGWTVIQPISVDLLPGAQGTVTVDIGVPSGTPNGRYIVTVRATSRGDTVLRVETNVTLDVSLPEVPPTVSSVSHEPQTPSSKEVVTVRATVTGSSISYVEITYSEGSTTHPAQRMTPAGSSTYTLAIGPFKADTVVKYRVRVYASSGRTAQSNEQSFVVKKAPVADDNTPGFDALLAVMALGACAAAGLAGQRRRR